MNNITTLSNLLEDYIKLRECFIDNKLETRSIDNMITNIHHKIKALTKDILSTNE